MKKQVILLALIMFVIVQAGASMQASAQVDDVDAPGGLKASPLHADYFQQDAHSALAQAIEAFSFAAFLSAPEKIAEPKSMITEPNPDYYDSMVFQSYRDRTWEIYWSSWSNLSSNFKRLTYNNAFDGEPRLNRGCTQIVFTSDRDGANNIYRMDSEGNDVVRLTQNAGNNINPTWSPDSARIAFVSDRDGNQEIYVMNSDGTQPWRLTYSPFPDIRPVYSPDGRQIAWIRVVDREYGVIMIADHTGANSHVISPPLRFLGGLVWSPQGDRLAFHFDHDLDGWSSLGIIGVDGADLQVVDFTSFPEQDFLLGSWSSSGKMLYATQIQWVFYRGRYYIQGIHTRRIYASGGGGNTIYYNQPDLYPYVQLADISIPESRLHPLPPYSRIQDFSVRYSVYDPGPAFVRGLYIETRVEKDGEWTLAGTICCPQSSGKFAYQGVPGQTVYL